MRILLVYDSLYGNTEQLAKAIENILLETYQVKILKADKVTTADTQNIDFLLVGSPTHGGWYSASIKAFLSRIPDDGLQSINAACFDTAFEKDAQKGILKLIVSIFGYASPRIAKALSNKGASFRAAETFFVIGKEGPLKAGELERAAKWASLLLD